MSQHFVIYVQNQATVHKSAGSKEETPRDLTLMLGRKWQDMYNKSANHTKEIMKYTSASTLILPRASASRASDVINMVKSSVIAVKNMWVSCLECLILQTSRELICRCRMHLLWWKGVPFSNRPRQEAVFCTVHNKYEDVGSLDRGFLGGWRR